MSVPTNARLNGQGKSPFTFIDLFAGAGGLSLGLEQAGFLPIFVNEIVPQFNETYRKNRNLSDEQYFVGDIKKLNEKIDEYLPRFRNADLVCGGPPCQGFSMANRQRIIDDPRNQLYKEYLKLLSVVRPKFFIMENVRGMSNKWEEIRENFETYLNGDFSKEYQFSSHLLYAEDFGVPQHRERFIVIGNRLGISPETVFDEIFKNKKKPFVLKNALEGLPKLGTKKVKGKNNIEDDDSGYTECDFTYKRNDFYCFINGNRKIGKLYNHKNRYNNPRDIEIYSRLPQGANSLHVSIEDIMPYKSRNDIFKDKYFKLEEDKVCKTITSHMRFDCNMYIHPWYARGLTPREAARIQTFPDDYVFYGSQNSWYAQIGNAVPVKLAYAIGKGISKFL
ncbi:DNA cytosine methyltransferase [uncultured Treponema sp.]|uniref:DNA cytosine methyltransferase n=1 Tax=uncultured Treponema sp. TaxID=162155 RepID=UPI003453E693